MANDCCSKQAKNDSCHPKNQFDFLLWGSLVILAFLYLHFWWFPQSTSFFNWYQVLASSVFELMNAVWWGLAIGLLMVALLSKIPREFVMSILGSQKGVKGILRATAAGVLLDLCSHGILMVGAKLYERGASLGQMMAFLIASPWNSFSLTFILIALIGWFWTLAFIALSILIAAVSGLVFDWLVQRKVLPANPAALELPPDFHFWSEAKKGLSKVDFSPKFFWDMMINGVKESGMILRWIFFGLLLTALIRAFMSEQHLTTFFGPTLIGLGLTILAATIIEVCSEGSAPIAADLLTRANAPGNSFAFLMAGVATDYTEIMVIKEATRSWKIAFFLPLVTVPQVIVLAILMNNAA